MSNQSASTWGCSQVFWFLVIVLNFGYFIGIPLLAWLLGQDAEKMHWGFKLLGIPLGIMVWWLIMFIASKGEVLAAPVGGIILLIFLIVKGLHVWMIVAGIVLLAGAAACFVVSRRKSNEAAQREFLPLPSNSLSWLDPNAGSDPLQRFKGLSEEIGSPSAQTGKLRKHAALFAFNGLVGLAFALIALAVGIIRLL